jgi:aerobic carbon-monoxide dehydrogenase medium subunit
MSEAPRLYHPTTIDQAAGILADLGDEAKEVAGATALTIPYRQRLITPSALVSIGAISGLAGIEERDGAIHLGAMVRHREVELSDLARGRIPVLAERVGTVANVRVRNAATVGGVPAESDYASDPPAVFVHLDAVVEVSGPNGHGTNPGERVLRRLLRDGSRVGRDRDRHFARRSRTARRGPRITSS